MRLKRVTGEIIFPIIANATGAEDDQPKVNRGITFS